MCGSNRTIQAPAIPEPAPQAVLAPNELAATVKTGSNKEGTDSRNKKALRSGTKSLQTKGSSGLNIPTSGNGLNIAN